MPTETFKNLSKIKIKECHEKMVDFKKYNKKIILSNYVKEKSYRSYLRKTVIDKLIKAQDYLPDGYKLRLECGFRTRDDQEILAKENERNLKKKYKSWNEKKINDYLNKIIFPSTFKIPPPHTTGGAVDVTLVSPKGKILKKGSLLAKAMSKAGFSNYKKEWWHWSYGDSGWAFRDRKKYAIYGEVKWKKGAKFYFK